MLTTLVIFIHVAVALALIFIILLQTTKGSGMGAAFGGASQTLFGSTGRATFLTKVTIVAAVVFCFTSLGLSFIWTGSSSVMDDYREPEQPAPTMPELPPLPSSADSDAGFPAGGPADETAAPGLDETPGLEPSSVPDLPETPAAPEEKAPAPDTGGGE